MFFENAKMRSQLLVTILTIAWSTLVCVGDLACTDDFVLPSHNLVFVSTLDGQVTAIDARRGIEKWKFQAGPALLSSSIHRLDLTNAGQLVRLVPSLKGTLYRFSGDSLEPLPLSAEQLLSSSFKYTDDLAFAGAKESSVIGISTKNGRIIYECSVNGCKNSTDLLENTENELGSDNTDIETREEIMLIHRTTQTVRASEPRTGHEKWNFSVGQHELTLPPFEGCVLPTKNTNEEYIYKVVVPEGIICAVEKNAPHNIIWKRKLNAPIVNAWHVENSKLKSVDLFGLPYVPNFSDDILIRPQATLTPSVYIGMHQRQLYIQESVRMQALVQSLSKPFADSSKRSSLAIPWRPYPAKISPEWDTDSTALSKINENEYSATGLSVLYASEYINGNGYFLYSEEDQEKLDDPMCEKDSNTTELANIEHLENDDEEEYEWADSEHITIFVVSLWYWWKEVLVIAITSAVFLNVLSNKIRGRVPPREVIHREYVIVERVESVPAPLNIPPPSSHPSELTLTPFVSRYLNDFTPMKCLGRGGFGVVFEAKNKIDDWNYAIKRISLPNNTEKREKVLREVRALAKLDHNNIVRYFNAWLEEPPFDWIDPYEREFLLNSDFSETFSKNTIPQKTSNVQKQNENIRIDLYSDYSIDEGYDALEYENKSKINKLKRQRSYSVDDSVSIVFENNAETTNELPSTSNHPPIDESDNSSYIQFASDSHNTIDIDNNPEFISNIDDGNDTSCKDTRVVCINESKTNHSKKSHRRNFSLDSKKFKHKKSRETIYLYIQMQLCQEESLRDWLQKNQDVEVRKNIYVNIFEQIVNAVEYVHLQGLIHRDLKPSNIFFSTNGQIKIGDFGLVTTMNDQFSSDTNFNSNIADLSSDKHTKHVGTHLYMSPEQIRGEPHNFKVDIWSLGLVLIELLIPFTTEMERVNVLKSLREQKFPNNFHILYPEEHSLLRLMLSPDPSERPSTFGVRAHPPFSHETDPNHHYCLPRRTTHSQSSTSSF